MINPSPGERAIQYALDRRELFRIGLTGAAGVAAGGGAGFASGVPYGERREAGKPQHYDIPGSPENNFRLAARKLRQLQGEQTAETVRALKAKYESPVLGRFRVWDLIEKLSFCIDPTDVGLGCVSQYMHVNQILSAMEGDRVLDEDMLLTALLHDLGKILLVTGEAPEHVVGFIRPVEEREPGIGLEQALLSFGHDELAYSRFKDLVPEHISWMLRYHSIVLGDCEPLMSAKDSEYEQKYLARFRKYDIGSKDRAFLPPQATLDRYRDFIESRFPEPILF